MKLPFLDPIFGVQLEKMFGPFASLFGKIFSKVIAPKVQDHVANKLANNAKFQEFVKKAENAAENLVDKAPDHLGRAKVFGGHFFSELKAIVREMFSFGKKK